MTHSFSVERFAMLCARGDEGMDPAEVEELRRVAREHWIPVLAAGTDTPFAVRFARAYARAFMGEDDRTVEVTSVRTRPVLPFKPPTPAVFQPVDTTVEMPKDAAPAAVFPFTASTTPERRLQRFDPQTGLPLAVPGWADDREPKR